ncbi:unnamed protein product, partial [Protopolystoma xenopodis]
PSFRHISRHDYKLWFKPWKQRTIPQAFCGVLISETIELKLRDYYGQSKEIDAGVMKYRRSGSSKGFDFYYPQITTDGGCSTTKPASFYLLGNC